MRYLFLSTDWVCQRQRHAVAAIATKIIRKVDSEVSLSVSLRGNKQLASKIIASTSLESNLIDTLKPVVEVGLEFIYQLMTKPHASTEIMTPRSSKFLYTVAISYRGNDLPP